MWQLVHQGLLVRVGDEYPVVHLTDIGLAVMRGEQSVSLLAPPQKPRRVTGATSASWEGVDRGLYEALRDLRRGLAQARGVPAYVIFSDDTLRLMAAEKPDTAAALLEIKGVGEKKLEVWGEVFLERIAPWAASEDSISD